MLRQDMGIKMCLFVFSSSPRSYLVAKYSTEHENNSQHAPLSSAQHMWLAASRSSEANSMSVWYSLFGVFQPFFNEKREDKAAAKHPTYGPLLYSRESEQQHTHSPKKRLILCSHSHTLHLFLICQFLVFE